MNKLIICVLGLGLAFSTAHGQDTAGEKTKAESHKSKGKLRRAGHRVKEGLCLDNDAKCKFQKGGDKSDVKGKTAEPTEKVD